MNSLSQLLQSLGTVRLAILGGVAVGLLALIMFMATRISSPDYALLYGNMEPEDSGAVVKRLEGMNVPFELRNNGRDVLVPGSQVARLRLDMAQEGLPNGGSVGYEIFDSSDTFGTTNFVQNVNLVRALEGELARTIRALNNVAAARVHLVLPKREVFSRDKREASASIVLKLKGRSHLMEDQVAAIQHLAAAAVPSLDPNRISIVDEKGNLLARGDGKEDLGKGVSSVSDHMRLTYESRLKERIEELLERSLGQGNVRAEVSALMDFDQKTIQSEVYDPDSQVVRSTQTVEEQSASSDGTNDGTVTVGNNLPEAEAAGANTSLSESTANRIEETVNFEISKTVTTQVRESGLIQRLTVAVLVNGRAALDADGNRVYEPLDQQALEQMSRLVKSAIGFDEDRGDFVEVINMPFVDIAPEPIAVDPATQEIFLGLNKNDLFKVGEMAVLAIVAILALLLVVRPLLTRALNVDTAADALAGPAAAGALAGAVPGGGMTALPPGEMGAGGTGDGGNSLESRGGIHSETLTELDEMIDIAKVEGQVKSSALAKVGEIVEKHPDEAVAILRNWLYHEN
nr:flagellar basal-body MS-ring/collar protein FliF [Sneathiella chinensis]